MIAGGVPAGAEVGIGIAPIVDGAAGEARSAAGRGDRAGARKLAQEAALRPPAAFDFSHFRVLFGQRKTPADGSVGRLDSGDGIHHYR